MLKEKALEGLEKKLSLHELWDNFYFGDDSDLLDASMAKAKFKCVTGKEEKSIKSNRKRKRIGAVCIGVDTNGIIQSVYESMRAETLSQLWIHQLKLVERYPSLNHSQTIVGYDNGCHYDAYKKNPKRTLVCKAAGIVASQKTIIDNLHIKGHKDPKCKILFNAKKNKRSRNYNTMIAEQAFSWFSLFKHMGRYMNKARYWILIIGVLNERNNITRKRFRASKSRKLSKK